MRFKIFYVAGCILVLSACSNPSKKSAEIVPPITANPITASTPAPAAAPAPTAAPTELKKDGTTCKKGQDLRTIEIEPAKPKGCQLWYTVAGKRNSIASSDIGPNHCEQVQSKISSNLKNAGFECVTAQTLPTTIKVVNTTTSSPAAMPAPTATPVAATAATSAQAVKTSPTPASTASPEPTPGKK